jgi:Sir2- and TIR-associating SLOG family/SIR2-like domain
MPISRQRLLTHYASSMHEGYAALFIGAGMSRDSGYVDWKGLLKECATELGLDVELEHDLVAVAQYYLNNRSMERGLLNQILIDEFAKPVIKSSESHKIIARLPISTIWTTNYDSLIEDSFKAANRAVDVKTRDVDISTHKKGAEVNVYKMHGDIAMPDKIIICKDDYERYAKDHYIFQNALEGDLVNKTFLFLGFSFTDPNLEYMLGHLRSLLEHSRREHYAIMREVRQNTHASGKEGIRSFKYAKNKQKLQIEDLKRYSIQTHLVEKFEDVTGILESLERLNNLRNIFVSGSAHEFGDFGESRMRELCMQLGMRLMAKKHKLVSGYGLNIGTSVVEGALLKLYEEGDTALEKSLLLRPFPRNLPSLSIEDEFNRKYREDMITKCEFAIFIAGTSRSKELSKGVLEEYEIVRGLGKIPIPIGATGFAARRIWEMMEKQIDSIYNGAVSNRLFKRLNSSKLGNEKLLDSVFEIISEVSDSEVVTSVPS